jgi:DNA-binding phage protein
MAKTKTSKKLKESRKTTFEKHESSASKELADKKLVRKILIEALTSNDMDTFQDVLVGYIRTSSKMALSKKTSLGRTTLYDLIDPEKPFNPTLDTIGKIFEELAA